MSQCEHGKNHQPCCRKRGGGGGGSVEPAALAALLASGGHGYDMRKTISEMSYGAIDVDVGGLYRALRRLEEDEAVVSRWSEEDAAGPRRREYELTEQGIERAEQWLDALRNREWQTKMLGDMLEKGLSGIGRTPEK